MLDLILTRYMEDDTLDCEYMDRVSDIVNWADVWNWKHVGKSGGGSDEQV